MAIVGHRVTGFFLPGRFDVHLLPGDASPDLFGGLASTWSRSTTTETRFPSVSAPTSQRPRPLRVDLHHSSD